MKIHPFVQEFPEIVGKEFDDLVEDIRLNGQLVEAVLDVNGNLIDGRNRFRACEKLGIKLKTKTMDISSDEDILSTIMSLNDRRRHLSDYERVEIAERLANLRHGSNRYEEKVDRPMGLSTSIQPLTEKKAAAIMGVGERTIRRAKKVKRKGTSEVKQAIKEGTLALRKAEEVVDLPPEEQNEELKKIKDAKINKTKDTQSDDTKNKVTKKIDIVDEWTKVLKWAVRKNFVTKKQLCDQFGLDKKQLGTFIKVVQSSTGFIITQGKDADTFCVMKAAHFWISDEEVHPDLKNLLKKMLQMTNEAYTLEHSETSAQWTKQLRFDYLYEMRSILGGLCL